MSRHQGALQILALMRTQVTQLMPDKIAVLRGAVWPLTAALGRDTPPDRNNHLEHVIQSLAASNLRGLVRSERQYGRRIKLTLIGLADGWTTIEASYLAYIMGCRPVLVFQRRKYDRRGRLHIGRSIEESRQNKNEGYSDHGGSCSLPEEVRSHYPWPKYCSLLQIHEPIREKGQKSSLCCFEFEPANFLATMDPCNLKAYEP